MGSLAIAIIVCLAGFTWVQVGYWKSSVDIFAHATEATAGNAVAHTLLAGAYATKGDEARSIEHLREARRIAPRFADAHYELTRALLRTKQVDEAAALCEEEEEEWPSDERTLVDLGMLAMVQKNFDEAARWFTEALRVNPDSVDAHFNLATTRSKQGRYMEFMTEYSRVVQLVGFAKAQELSRRSAAHP